MCNVTKMLLDKRTNGSQIGQFLASDRRLFRIESHKVLEKYPEENCSCYGLTLMRLHSDTPSSTSA